MNIATTDLGKYGGVPPIQLTWAHLHSVIFKGL
jgi:hypothetical protein